MTFILIIHILQTIRSNFLIFSCKKAYYVKKFANYFLQLLYDYRYRAGTGTET